MLTKQISPNPNITGNRYVVCNLTVSEDEVVIYGHTEYRDSVGELIPDTVQKNFTFSTKGNLVDATGQPAVMIHVPILDGEGNPTGETNPERPAGTMEEHIFLKNIPADMFPDTTLRGRIERLISMRIDRLDNAGSFN